MSTSESPRYTTRAAGTSNRSAIESATAGSGLSGASGRAPCTTTKSAGSSSAATMSRVSASDLLEWIASGTPSPRSTRTSSGTPS